MTPALPAWCSLAALLFAAPATAQDAGAAQPAESGAGETRGTVGPSVPPDRLEAGRASFAAGLEAERAGRWDQALRAFQASAEVRVTAAVLFHLGLCHDRLGDPAAALTAFEAAWARAQRDGAADVVRAAPGHLARLRPTLGRVTVRGTADAGAVALLDGRVVAVDAVVAVAPGAHRAELRAGGQAPRSLDFTIAAGAERTIELGPAAAIGGAAVPPPAEAPPASMWTTPRVAGVIVGVTGALSLGGAAVLYAMRGSALDDIRAQCGGALESCPEAARGDFDRGRTATVAGNVMLGVGAAGVVGGAALFLLGAPDTSAPPTGAAPARPRAGATPTRPRTGLAGAPGADAGISVWRSF